MPTQSGRLAPNRPSSSASSEPRGERWRLSESAGINRHGEGDESALRRRIRSPRWPRVMRWRSARAQRSVDRGTCGLGD
jgi:hypothetical protein